MCPTLAARFLHTQLRTLFLRRREVIPSGEQEDQYWEDRMWRGPWQGRLSWDNELMYQHKEDRPTVRETSGLQTKKRGLSDLILLLNNCLLGMGYEQPLFQGMPREQWAYRTPILMKLKSSTINLPLWKDLSGCFIEKRPQKAGAREREAECSDLQQRWGWLGSRWSAKEGSTCEHLLKVQLIACWWTDERPEQKKTNTVSGLANLTAGVAIYWETKERCRSMGFGEQSKLHFEHIQSEILTWYLKWTCQVNSQKYKSRI